MSSSKVGSVLNLEYKLKIYSKSSANQVLTLNISLQSQAANFFLSKIELGLIPMTSLVAIIDCCLVVPRLGIEAIKTNQQYNPSR